MPCMLQRLYRGHGEMYALTTFDECTLKSAHQMRDRELDMTQNVAHFDLPGSAACRLAPSTGCGGGPSGSVSLALRSNARPRGLTAANHRMNAPDTAPPYKAFSQSFVNARGELVFKGQSKSIPGPTIGVYAREMSPGGDGPVMKLTENMTPVSQPNNTSHNGALAAFIQFQSFPWIDEDSDTAAFRGQSQPVRTFALADGTEMRIGSTGVYTSPQGALIGGTGVYITQVMPQ